MSELDHCREQSSTRFVSLDTHPANNSLVVTYETLVLVRDPANGRELCRRSKRDQFQIRIAALDHLNNENSSAAIGGDGDDSSTSGGGGDRLREVKLNLRKLSEEILAKCPILSEANRAETLEDIQLNLFYLINRKQAQLTNPTASQRPPSSASMRLRSNTSTLLSTGSARLMSARQGSAANTIAAGPRASRDPSSQTHRSTDGGGGSDNPLEVYLCFCERELRLAKRRDYLDYERLDVFVKQFDEHLSELESELKLDRLPRMGCQLEDLEAQLENLYGEMDERRCSIAIIRRIVRNDSDELISVGSNRLLVCALLRILRDSEGPSTSRDCSAMSESILYCLIRFTSFEDVFNATAFGEVAITGDNESLDLVRVILDILDGHIKWLTVNCDNDFRLLTSNSYYTNALLIVLANILRLDSTGGGGGDASHRIKQRIIQQHGAKLVDILSGLLNLSVKHLARDIRTTSNKSQERLTVTLLETLSIFRQFTIFKAFVNLIRPAARIQPLVDSLVALLNTLQLSRPGSGSNNQLQQVLAGDRATLSKIYELEIELMSVIGNLIYDLRFRTRFTRNNLLLKCILRSLVVLLAANRRSDTLHPFNNSQVLIVPLRCLYELSCSDKIKHELFESRVIVKCLLEYLLSSTNNLRGELDVHLSATGNPDQMEPLPGETDNLEAVSSSSTSSTARLRRVLIGDKLDLNENDQIVLSTRDASQYIVSLWINLSSKPEAPIYKQTDEDILRLLQDYIQLALTNLEQFTKLLARVVLASNPMTTTTTILIDEHLLRSLRHLHLMNYVHMKLIRNMTQFLAPTSQIPLEKLIQSIDELLNCSQQQVQFQATFVPLLVECLASLTNVIDRSISNDQQRIGLHSQKLASILSSLFGDNGRPLIDGAPPSTMDMENDDLLLIAINYLGCLARVSEICPYLESIQDNLIRTIQLVLQLRSADLEMVICCLFTLDQLMNHSQFIRELGSSLDEMTGEQHSGEPNQLLAHQLIEQLSLLIMHPNSLVVGFADQILNKLKQFEESQSLADSVTGQKRFAIYNSKWLNAIRANREDPPTDGAADLTEAEQEVSFAIRARQNGNGGGGSITTIDDEEETDLEEYRQLRTINADDTSRTWSRLTSTSSVSRSSSRFVVGTKSDRRHNQQQGTDDGGEFEGDEMIDNEDEEEEEDTSSEPDVNVIDSLSMIGHLTSGRELRGAGSELSRR